MLLSLWGLKSLKEIFSSDRLAYEIFGLLKLGRCSINPPYIEYSKETEFGISMGTIEQKKRKLYVKDIPGRDRQVDVSFPWGHQRNSKGILPVIYTAIDDASRCVYSKIFTDHTELSTLIFVQDLIKQRKFPIRAIRTDQGREFSRMITIYL